MKKERLLLFLLFSIYTYLVNAQISSGIYTENGIEWQYTIQGNEATIVGENSNNIYMTGELKIPEIITTEDLQSYPVTAIGDNAFQFYDKISSVTLPSYLKKIGTNAFSNCDSITGPLVLPPSIITIGERAFYNCNFTGKLEIPSSVTKLGKGAFEGCKKITGVTLPDGLTEIADALFSGCSELTGSITIPSSVKRIGKKAFMNCSNIEDFQLPEGLKTIDDKAFNWTQKLTNIKIPQSVTLIGRYAFFASSIKKLEIENNNINIKGNAFNSCLQLEKIDFNNSIISLEDSAFWNCFNLSSLELSPNTIKIGNCAFKSCNQLKFEHLDIPASVQSIGKLAFCDSPIKKLTLHNGLNSVALNAFYGYHGAVVIPKTVTRLDESVYVDYHTIHAPIHIAPFESITLAHGSQLQILGNNFVGVPSEGAYDILKDYKFIDLTQMSDHVTGDNGSYADYKAGHGTKDGLNTIGRANVSQSNAFRNLPAHIMVYMPASYKERVTDANGGENFVFGNECEHFVAYDGFDYPIQHEFTAKTAKYTREFSGISCKTIYLPYSTPLPDGMKAYELVKENNQNTTYPGGTFRFVQVTSGLLQANHPYLVRVTDGGTHTFPELQNITVPVSPDINTTAINATNDGNWKFVGTTDRIKHDRATALGAYNLNNNTWLPINDGDANGHVAAFRCFIMPTTGTVPTAAKSFAIVLEDSDATGINTPKELTENELRSGKLTFYTIDGKRVGNNYDTLKSGDIYIVKGQKFYKF